MENYGDVNPRATPFHWSFSYVRTKQFGVWWQSALDCFRYLHTHEHHHIICHFKSEHCASMISCLSQNINHLPTFCIPLEPQIDTMCLRWAYLCMHVNVRVDSLVPFDSINPAPIIGHICMYLHCSFWYAHMTIYYVFLWWWRGFKVRQLCIKMINK